MSNPKKFSNRQYVIGGIVALIILIYIGRLFSLQVMSDKYKTSAESNALYKEIIYPSRGQILDRNGELLVYNEPSYNIMVVMKDQVGVDTAEFCKLVGITPEFYAEKMKEIKNKRNYSKYQPQLFMAQIPAEEFSIIREKLSRFKGFKFEKRSSRKYTTPYAAHILGDVGEVNEKEMETDEYYKNGDIIGKLGVERSYEKQLRGQKGERVLLRDVRGRIKGRFEDGKYDVQAIPGKDITLTIDMKLQALAERLLQNKVGSIVAIEPKTGEVLCMASSPTYDPNLLVGRDRGKNHKAIRANKRKPMINRAVMGTYPPGSTFKITQTLIGLQEGIITPETQFPCSRGFNYKGLHVGCHGHAAPIALVPAIATSCNSYFCWNLYRSP
jgi:penicillin-binding protein 2